MLINLGSIVYALLFVRREPDLSKLPIQLLEHSFIYSAIAYELGGVGVLPDSLWDDIGLELVSRRKECGVDFLMAVNLDILTMKSTNLAIDLESPLCHSARQTLRNLETIAGVL
jgi:hypothetical protein